MITLIAAVAKNGVIGKQNTIPWSISEEQQLFKEITLGHPIIMGRKTYDSIGKPLPGRTNIVVSNQQEEIPGCTVVNSIEQALKTAQSIDKDIFIIGGGKIYAQTIDAADRLIISHIPKNIEGDVFFPTIDEKKWQVENEKIYKDFIHITYSRIL